MAFSYNYSHVTQKSSIVFVLMLHINYRKSSIKPPGGGLFNFRGSRGGLNRTGRLIREGECIQKFKIKDTNNWLDTLKKELGKTRKF